MIKTTKTTKQLQNKTKEIKFPVLAERIFDKYVVLFISNHEGMLISGGVIGYFSKSWSDICDENVWRVLDPTETITLYNEL